MTVSAFALFLPLLAPPQEAPRAERPVFDCGYISHEEWVPEFEAALARGEVARGEPMPAAGIQRGSPSGPPPCISGAHVFPFEDSAQILQSNFSDNQLINLMTNGANALIAQWGDNFDFIGFWTNSASHHEIGAAFYLGVFNDTSGIGQGPFNFRGSLGLNTSEVQGYVMMWDVNHGYWEAGTGPGADFTRLALAQEFEHRFAMFLPSLNDGRVLQGNNANCGRGAHWNWKVDGQGSGMEISEWVGTSPANPVGTFVTFNTDIPGGVFSYSDLYLMGYVSPAEMDAGNSELRYMETSDCASPYNGVISSFSSADIIASAGARVPDSTASQKDYRTAWVMLHQPGDLPSAGELNKASGILATHMDDWWYSVLNRGVMDNTLFDDCNCNDVPDQSEGSSVVRNGSGVNPLGFSEVTPALLGSSWDTQVNLAGATLSILAISPIGAQQVMRPAGELLIRPPYLKPLSFSGTGNHSIPIPVDCSLIGRQFWTQAATRQSGQLTLQNAIDVQPAAP